MILSASGGLVYHTRAAFSFDRWSETRRSVSTLVRAWLEDDVDDLIIVGPSAGYLLDRDLFGARHITVIDPDQIASVIFRARFPSSTIDWHSRDDLLPFTSRQANSFDEFIESRKNKTGKNAAVLFLGVLGQIDLHAKDFTRSKAEASRKLIRDLEDVKWASLHDLESTTLAHSLKEIPPSFAALTQTEHFKKSEHSRARIEMLSEEFARLGITTGAWLDHETEWLGMPQQHLVWHLTAKRFHLLGWIAK